MKIKPPYGVGYDPDTTRGESLTVARGHEDHEPTYITALYSLQLLRYLEVMLSGLKGGIHMAAEGE